MISFFGWYRSKIVLTHSLPKEPVPPVIRIDLSLNMFDTMPLRSFLEIVFGCHVHRARCPLTRCMSHLPKTRAAHEQLFVRALCHHTTALKFHDGVATPHAGEPVGDEQDGEVAAEPFDRVQHRLL